MPSPAIEHCIRNSQPCIPLSYAAQIPTTRNPDLANVRVSLSNVDQAVRKRSARVFASVCLLVLVCIYGWPSVLCVCVRVRVNAQMMLVYSNIHREATAQVKGAAKIMVTVVAIQELKSGDLLRRFKAEAAQDEPRRGNNIAVVGLVAVGVRKL